MKRECGEGFPDSAAAPATVSGEPLSIEITGTVRSREGRREATSRKPGDRPAFGHPEPPSVGRLEVHGSAPLAPRPRVRCSFPLSFSPSPVCAQEARADELPDIVVTADRVEEPAARPAPRSPLSLPAEK